MVDEKFALLLDAMPDAVIAIGIGGTVAFANDHAASLLGYAIGELIGKPLEMIVPHHFWERFAECAETDCDELSHRPMPGGLSFWALGKHDREVPVDISFSCIETDQGSLVVANMRDATPCQKMEAELRSALADVQQMRDRLEKEILFFREEIQRSGGYEEFIGKSEALQQMLKRIDQVARTDATVLILGETGTGKELVAQAIHVHSDRKEGPLVNINCAALPDSLMESELFGHEAGAFTGAMQRKIGRFELADGGTIFLDEIGEMPIELQSKLLRVIQEGMFWRLGSASTTHVNVRVIAATNRDLSLAMQQEKFRSDLYYRLAVFLVEVPTLRTRRDDIPLLVSHFISQKQARLGKKIEQISAETMDSLSAYPWPGNIRELENVLERAIILSPGSTLIVEPLLDAVAPLINLSEASSGTSGSMNEIVRIHLLSVLEECHWRIKGTDGAAERLDIKPSTLRYRMKKLGLKRP